MKRPAKKTAKKSSAKAAKKSAKKSSAKKAKRAGKKSSASGTKTAARKKVSTASKVVHGISRKRGIKKATANKGVAAKTAAVKTVSRGQKRSTQRIQRTQPTQPTQPTQRTQRTQRIQPTQPSQPTPQGQLNVPAAIHTEPVTPLKSHTMENEIHHREEINYQQENRKVNDAMASRKNLSRHITLHRAGRGGNRGK